MSKGGGVSRSDLVRHLEDHGAYLWEHLKKHDRYRHDNGGQTTIPRHTTVMPGTARGICDQLGVPRPPWLGAKAKKKDDPSAGSGGEDEGV